MLTHTKFTTEGGAGGVVAYLFSDYYLNKNPAQWLGDGAKQFELDRLTTVEQQTDALKRMLMGYHPTADDADGKPVPLVQNAGASGRDVAVVDHTGKPVLLPDGTQAMKREGDRVMCHDITWSVQKDLSCAWSKLPTDMQAVFMRCKDEANAAMIADMQRDAYGRTGKDGAHEEQAGMVVLGVRHTQSRENDMQIHTHNAVMNLATLANGKTTALETEGLLHDMKGRAARANADLVRRLELEPELNLKIDRVPVIDERTGRPTGEIAYRVHSITDDETAHFSKRTEQIDAYKEKEAAEGRVVGHDKANHATRAQKDEDTTAHALERWRDERAARGLSNDHAMMLRDAQEQAPTAPGWHTWDMTEFTRSFFESTGGDAREMHFSNLVHHVSRWTGPASRDEQEQIAREISLAHFTRVAGIEQARTWADRQSWFVPTDALAMEQGLAEHGLRSRSDTRHQAGITADGVARTIAAWEERVTAAARATDPEADDVRLNREQRDAVAYFTIGSGSVACLSGLAGTGKTTCSEIAVEVWRAAGYRTIGVSISQSATNQLAADAKTDLAMNAAKMLADIEHGALTLTDKDIILFDEAGMCDLHTMSKIIDAQRAVGAKLVPMGDTRQMQAISGASFKKLREAIGGGLRLTQVMRQTGDDLKPTEALYDRDKDGRLKAEAPIDQTRTEERQRSAEIWDAAAKQWKITVTATTDQAVAAAAEGFAFDPVPLDKKIGIAATNELARAANAAVHDHLRTAQEDILDKHGRPTGKQQAVIRGPDFFVQDGLKNLKGKSNNTLKIAVGEPVVFSAAHTCTAKEPGWAAEDRSGKKQPRFKIENNMRGRVEKIEADKDDPSRMWISVRVDRNHKQHAGALVRFRDDGKIAWAQASFATSHKRQGATVMASHTVAQGGGNNERALTDGTRYKTNKLGAVHLYASHETADAMRGGGLGRHKQNRTLTDLIQQREDKRIAIEPTAARPVQSIAGTLQSHGPAHDTDGVMSYRATIATADGVRTVWGAPIERAIAESKARAGDAVTVRADAAHARMERLTTDAPSALDRAVLDLRHRQQKTEAMERDAKAVLKEAPERFGFHQALGIDDNAGTLAALRRVWMTHNPPSAAVRAERDQAGHRAKESVREDDARSSRHVGRIGEHKDALDEARGGATPRLDAARKATGLEDRSVSGALVGAIGGQSHELAGLTGAQIAAQHANALQNSMGDRIAARTASMAANLPAHRARAEEATTWATAALGRGCVRAERIEQTIGASVQQRSQGMTMSR